MVQTCERAVATEVTADHAEEIPERSELFWVGVGLSIAADAVVAISLGVQKLAHNRNRGPDGEPKKHFVFIPLWWLGIIMNASGEVGNMLAYGMAPASVVAPVGSVGVLVNQIIAVTFLGEPFRRRDVPALMAIIGGIVLVIIMVPESAEQFATKALLSDQYYGSIQALVYWAFVIISITFFIIVLEPRKAKNWILVWVLLCSGISSLTVMACRGFSSLITSMPIDCAPEVCSTDGLMVPNTAPCQQTVAHWLFWVLLLAIIVTAIWSANYLNKAMMHYGNTEVVPIYYCTFTLASIIGCAVVYNELKNLTIVKGFGFLGGVAAALCGVLTLMSGRTLPDHELPEPHEEEDAQSVVIMISGKFSSPSHRKTVGARRSRKGTNMSEMSGRQKADSEFSSATEAPEKRPPAPSITEESGGQAEGGGEALGDSGGGAQNTV
jgi:drug/metabolite transporter (DMT)-like permease